ncbi:MAG: NUDIX hydrolase [Melioribacteraceae bacterium]|nr:NUDIX hydrolase [Melioribacteraceae bacterium]
MPKVPEYFFNQSAVIPYKIENMQLKIMLITSRKKKRWIIPKGVIEPGMTPRESALREALEEAGCIGEVEDEKIGSYEICKWEGICSVDVYPMKVNKEFDSWEEDFRDRAWFTTDEVLNKIYNEDIKKVIQIFINKMI